MQSKRIAIADARPGQTKENAIVTQVGLHNVAQKKLGFNILYHIKSTVLTHIYAPPLGYMRAECQKSCDQADQERGIETFADIKLIKSFFQLSALDIDKNPFEFSNLEGKITVVVNVASHCGYTESHYRGLKELYDQAKESNAVEILAFPSNQFGSQEPGSCEEIKKFAVEEKGAEYRMMDKIDVNGPDAHHVYKFLKREAGPPTIAWNFATYFVISPTGEVRSYSGVQPMELKDLIFGMLEKEL